VIVSKRLAKREQSAAPGREEKENGSFGLELAK
jgi:hypothetical protein